MADTGTSFDLSSDVFLNGYEFLCGTFFGSLVEQVTSCSIWIKKTSGHVTKICPGLCGNFAWGTGGGKKGLKSAHKKCRII